MKKAKRVAVSIYMELVKKMVITDTCATYAVLYNYTYEFGS
jgi:hypothetical protein